jgi:hypothetical protein
MSFAIDVDTSRTAIEALSLVSVVKSTHVVIQRQRHVDIWSTYLYPLGPYAYAPYSTIEELNLFDTAKENTCGMGIWFSTFPVKINVFGMSEASSAKPLIDICAATYALSNPAVFPALTTSNGSENGSPGGFVARKPPVNHCQSS